jgi:hypothetical protein
MATARLTDSLLGASSSGIEISADLMSMPIPKVSESQKDKAPRIIGHPKIPPLAEGISAFLTRVTISPSGARTDKAANLGPRIITPSMTA